MTFSTLINNGDLNIISKNLQIQDVSFQVGCIEIVKIVINS